MVTAPQDEDRRRRRSERESRCISVVVCVVVVCVVGAAMRGHCSCGDAVSACGESMPIPTLSSFAPILCANSCARREEREQRRASIIGRPEGTCEVGAAMPQLRRATSLLVRFVHEYKDCYQ